MSERLRTIRVFSVVGTRPQFVKLAMICRALKRPDAAASVEHAIVHTGQHYDAEMNEVFFRDLDIPTPDFHLGIGSGTHGEQTGEMIKRLEPVLSEHRPDWVLLYGDTNSTLAGAIAGAKLGLSIAHIEAGLRSYNRRMPEEINRVVADHLSDMLLCPTAAAIRNLEKEGLADRAILCGDIMYDASLCYANLAETRGGKLAEQWKPKAFGLATVHRAENADDPTRLKSIFEALEYIAGHICPVLLPLHPRTRNALQSCGLSPSRVTVIPPASYLEMLLLERRARFILTDSGGVQKEAYFAQVPCITMRDETEWVETLDNYCNVLTGANTPAIVAAVKNIDRAGPWTAVYGDGRAAHAILDALHDQPVRS